LGLAWVGYSASQSFGALWLWCWLLACVGALSVSPTLGGVRFTWRWVCKILAQWGGFAPNGPELCQVFTAIL